MISEPDGLKATVNEQVARWRQRNDSDVNGDEHAGAGYVEQRIGIGLPMSHIFSTCVAFRDDRQMLNPSVAQLLWWHVGAHVA